MFSNKNRYEPPSQRTDRYDTASSQQRYNSNFNGDRMGYESRTRTERYESHSGAARTGGRYGGDRNASMQEQGYRNPTSRYDSKEVETISAADESDTWRRGPTTERKEQNFGGYQHLRSNYEPKNPSNSEDSWRSSNRTTNTPSTDTQPKRYIPPSMRK